MVALAWLQFVFLPHVGLVHLNVRHAVLLLSFCVVDVFYNRKNGCQRQSHWDLDRASLLFSERLELNAVKSTLMVRSLTALSRDCIQVESLSMM